MQINFIWKITILKYITFRDQIKIAEVYDTELPFSLTDTSKNIYVCNDSHRTSAEHRQKSSDSKRARKSPSNWVRQRQKKKKKTEKEIGMGSAPLGGRCEGGKGFHTLGSPLTGGDRESFGALEESTATSVLRAKQRDLHRAWVLTHTSQPERLVHSANGVGWG